MMKRKLIIHVGMEKTGTSSIQHTFRKNKSVFQELGYYYLGLLLEEFSLKKYSWQDVRGWNNFISQERNQSNKELICLFNEIDDRLPREYNTLVWSNESLFNNPTFFSTAIHWLRKKFDIHIVGYTRKHDAWIQSAYLQWGIKHKTYKGPLKSFSEWVGDKRFPTVSFVSNWESYTENHKFYDFDEISDVCEHFFCDFLGIPKRKIILFRVNETPPAAQLALFALYNSSFDGEVLPYRLEDLFKINSLASDSRNIKELSHLLPSENDLQSYYCNYLSQISSSGFNEKECEKEHNKPKLKIMKYDQSDINLELLKLCISLHERVSKLEGR